MSTRQPTAESVEPAASGRLIKILAAAGVVLALAVVGLGIAYATKPSGGTTFVHQDCVIGVDPNCTLRQKVHWHADFAVYIDGKQYDFGTEEYISHEDEELSIYAHIHDPRHTVAHIHYEQTTWSEFFRSLGWNLIDPSQNVSLEQTCMTMLDGTKLCNEQNGKTFKFFVNGVKVDGIAGMDMSDLSRVLVSYGTETEDQARAQFNTVTDQACIPSELCRDRLPPEGEPPEPCSKSGTTCQ